MIGKERMFFTYLKPVIRNHRNIREDDILNKNLILKYQTDQCYTNLYIIKINSIFLVQ